MLARLLHLVAWGAEHPRRRGHSRSRSSRRRSSSRPRPSSPSCGGSPRSKRRRPRRRRSALRRWPPRQSGLGRRRGGRAAARPAVRRGEVRLPGGGRYRGHVWQPHLRGGAGDAAALPLERRRLHRGARRVGGQVLHRMSDHGPHAARSTQPAPRRLERSSHRLIPQPQRRAPGRTAGVQDVYRTRHPPRRSRPRCYTCTVRTCRTVCPVRPIVSLTADAQRPRLTPQATTALPRPPTARAR